MHIPWATSTIYQIYPRSFYDTNNDGVGDLQGIIAKLDYLQGLGIDTLWLNPIYPSSEVDAGYDITDHTAIDPIFGTMRDLDELIKQAHKRKLKIMLDFIPNHTSDQHPWFLESATDKTNAKRDWYTWHDPALDGGPPNNWLSVFGGSAWTFDATTQQYYLHTFYPQQPDLNLRNPHVLAALRSIMRFYLSRGVDAFRLDAASHLIKDDQFRDNELKANWREIPDPYEQQIHNYDKNLLERIEVINEFSRTLDEYPGTYLISESYLNAAQLQQIHAKVRQHNHTACNFLLLEPPYRASELATVVNRYLKMCQTTRTVPTWILGNHDRERIVSKYGPSHARLLAMLQLTLPGTAFVYYGEELGMTMTPIPQSLKHDTYAFQERDAQRTPMQWDNTPNAGFTSHQKPWLPLNPHFTTCNVTQQLTEETSSLHLYQSLLTLRTQFTTTDHDKITHHHGVLTYRRSPYQIILNFTTDIQKLETPITIHLSTYGDKKGEAVSELRPFEGIISVVTP